MEGIKASDCCCHNENCSDYKKYDNGNIIFKGWSGKRHDIHLIHCKTCKITFSSRKGTPLENSKIPEETAISAIEHISEGVGTRATARLVHISNNTVTRLSRKSGEHARLLHELLVPFSPTDKRNPSR